MEVEVPHVTEWMVCCRTASNPAKIRTLLIRIGLTIGLMLSPALPNLVLLTTVQTDISALIRSISTMLGLLVLFQPLGTSNTAYHS